MNASAFLSRPLRFGKTCLIYPPSINNILDDGLYSQYVFLLTKSQEEIWDDITKEEEMNEVPDAVTPFELLMMNCYTNGHIKKLTEKAFYFFTRENVLILPEQKVIIFKDSLLDEKGEISKNITTDNIRKIDEDNFFNFQNFIRESVGVERLIAHDEKEDPRISRLKAKFRKREKLLSKIKAKKGVTLTTTLAALCCMGIGLNPLNIGEISYATAQLLMKTLQAKEQYETDILSLVNGGDAKKIKPKYWITTIEEKK